MKKLKDFIKKKFDCRKLILHPEQGVVYDPIENIYHVISIPAKLKVFIEGGVFPEGWCLFKGSIKRMGYPIRAKLVIKTNKECIVYQLPVSLKGTILELVKFPSNTKEVYFEPMDSVGKFGISEQFQIKSISSVERLYRMIKRVLFFFQKRYNRERKILGLKFSTLLFNLPKAYELANKIGDYDACLDYDLWVKMFDSLNKNDIKKIKKDIEKNKPDVKFYVIIFNDKNKKALESSIKSLKNQLYSNYELKIVENDTKFDVKKLLFEENSFNLNEKLFLVFLKAGTFLSPHCLYWMFKEARNLDVDLLYSDHDYITENGKRSNPYFKPDFSLEFLRSTNYIDWAFAVKASLLLKIENLNNTDFLNSDSHSLLFKIIENTSPTAIKHIPAILFHFPLQNEKHNQTDVTEKKLSEVNPVKEHLLRLGIKAKVDKTSPKCYKVIYEIRQRELISIIIPTKNKTYALKTCVESILNKSTYENYEIIIVDNQSSEIEALEYLKEISKNPKIRILSYDKPFNYSSINNFAVTKARGEVLVFLNNDTEVITPQWLEIMLGCLQQPMVGAVGVKLYYPNGLIQHAGVILGIGGCADHAFKYFEKTEKGYMCRAILQQEYSAVTSACMMTRKDLFIKMGGFDEKNLPISFNDVDYCLKLREAGYRIVFTPYVELYHHESLTRKEKYDILKDQYKKEADYMRKKWFKFMEFDPYYNPNLDLRRPDFSISPFPRVKKPWESG
ncbi:MAG: glycosyltransferase family 2 protein [Thermofilaceae archaeon]